MQSFMLSSKSAQFLEYMDLRTRTSHVALLAKVICTTVLVRLQNFIQV